MSYLETFHLRPAEISWRDYEIYQACLQARQEYLAGMQQMPERRMVGSATDSRRLFSQDNSVGGDAK